jgi:hypothetical protein
LNDPKGLFLIFLKDKLGYIPQISENFNTSSLIESGRFHDPHVICAVFEWSSFILAATLGQLPKTIHELLNISIVRCSSNYESSGCGVKE